MIVHARTAHDQSVSLLLRAVGQSLAKSSPQSSDTMSPYLFLRTRTVFPVSAVKEAQLRYVQEQPLPTHVLHSPSCLAPGWLCGWYCCSCRRLFSSRISSNVLPLQRLHNHTCTSTAHRAEDLVLVGGAMWWSWTPPGLAESVPKASGWLLKSCSCAAAVRQDRRSHSTDTSPPSLLTGKRLVTGNCFSSTVRWVGVCGGLGGRMGGAGGLG